MAFWFVVFLAVAGSVAAGSGNKNAAVSRWGILAPFWCLLLLIVLLGWHGPFGDVFSQ